MKLRKSDIEQLIYARDILYKNQNKQVTIHWLSMTVGMNSNKLKYGFKQQFGISVHAFQVQLRMEKAKELLKETDIPIKEIALITGYRNTSSFSVAFKKCCNTAPSWWRNQNE